MIYALLSVVCLGVLLIIQAHEIGKLQRTVKQQWVRITKVCETIEAQRVLINGVKILAEHTAQEQAKRHERMKWNEKGGCGEDVRGR